MRLTLSCACIGMLLNGCADHPAVPGGPRVEIAVASLNLPGVGVVCYDIEVTTPGDTVWSQGDPELTLLGHDQADAPDATLAVSSPVDATTICSDRFGNGPGGSITYVGPCDASAEADTLPGGTVQNLVTVWVDGLYNAGKTAELGEWRDPCPDGCGLHIDCEENEDALASFDLTVMREANQGFFDIAVNFEDIFCSAKLDTCHGADPIRLLHGADEERDWTAVFGFACTAGPDADITNLLYGVVQVDCGDSAWFLIDPTQDAGNALALDGDNELNYGIYRGLEQLDCGAGVGPCKKAYWNLAFSIDDLRALNATCTVKLTATANDDNDGFLNGLPTATGNAYPYIDVVATLTTEAASPATMGVATCQQHALNDASGVVATTYKGTVEGLPEPATVMCWQYDGTAGPTDALEGCTAECPAEGPCVDLRQKTFYCDYLCPRKEDGTYYQVRCTCNGYVDGKPKFPPGCGGSCNLK